MGFFQGHGVWPSTSPPGGVWRRRMLKRVPSPKPVAAARPLMMTTASNLNVALQNKKQPTTHPNKQSPLPSLFLEHHLNFFLICCSCTRENQSCPSEGGDSYSARRHFPCVLLHCSPCPLAPFPFFLAFWNWSVHEKGNECTRDSALNRLTHFIDADDTLMILIKIGSEKLMFQYEFGCLVYFNALT